MAYGVFGPGAEQTIGFFLSPSFSMLPFVSAVESLRLANRLSGRNLFAWRILTQDGAPVRASNGMAQVPDGTMTDDAGLSMVLVCGPHEPHGYRAPKVYAWLRSMARHGTAMGGLCTGSYVLARAGLLNGYRCTIHWENLPGFAEAFPNIDVTSELFEIDRDRYTCSGGTSSIDMMLHLIERRYGHELAGAVSENMLIDRIRSPHDHQRMQLRHRLGVSNNKLLQCVELMEGNVEEPLTPEQLAASTGVSRRQIERLFRQHLQTTPARYYMTLRLRRGQQLLEQTSLPVTHVSLACGFTSAAHFSLRYRELYGVSPRAWRRLQ